MAKTAPKLKLVAYALIVLLLLFGLLQIMRTGQGTFLMLEVIGFVVLLILSLAGFIGYTRRWGQPLLFLVFLFYLGNLILIWYFKDLLYLTLLVLAVMGFVLNLLPPARKSPSKPKVEELHSMVFDEPAKKEAPPAKEIKAEVKFSPGKYVASRNSNVYHEPKCDWAKKIIKDRQVWFADRKAALDKGYKKHSCVA